MVGKTLLKVVDQEKEIVTFFILKVRRERKEMGSVGIVTEITQKCLGGDQRGCSKPVSSGIPWADLRLWFLPLAPSWPTSEK